MPYTVIVIAQNCLFLNNVHVAMRANNAHKMANGVYPDQTALCVSGSVMFVQTLSQY